MRNIYIKPTINVVSQVYSEGFIALSVPYKPGGTTGGGDAKPGGEWGDVWSEPTTDSTTEGDDWGI